MPAFLAPVDYPVGTGPLDVKAGDFNGDGILDLATANLYGRSVSVLLGNADGTFQSRRNSVASAYPYDLAVGDFNQDGKLDLATSANGPADVGVNVLLGQGDGRFVNVNPILLSSGFLGFPWSSAIATGDLDGFGTLDLVTTSVDPYDGYSDVRVNFGFGNGGFSYRLNDGTNPGSPTFSYALALADFDRDGILDLVIGGSDEIWVSLGNGDGTFQWYNDLGMGATSLTVADFNADGKLDLAATSNGSVAVLRGNGDGSFQAAQSFAAGADPRSVNAADVNGDSVLDLVVTNYQNAGGLSALVGNGDGSFGLPITIATGGSYTASVVVADFNADGRPDAAVTDSASNTVSVLLNDGNWSAVMPGDVNFDGQVNVLDVNVVSAHWNESGLQGDANHDGAVNIFDINLISANWTTNNGEGGGGADAMDSDPLRTASESASGATSSATNVLAGDLNADATVDDFDVNLLSTQWGRVQSSQNSSERLMPELFAPNAIISNWGHVSIPTSVATLCVARPLDDLPTADVVARTSTYSLLSTSQRPNSMRRLLNSSPPLSHQVGRRSMAVDAVFGHDHTAKQTPAGPAPPAALGLRAGRDVPPFYRRPTSNGRTDHVIP